MRRRLSVLALLLLAPRLAAAQPVDLKAKVDAWVTAHQGRLVTELVDLLRIPNVAADRANIQKNAVALQKLLQQRGMDAQVLETPGNPLVWAELKAPGATRTLLFYAHYDGQPVNAKEWKQAGGPWAPILRSGRMEDNAPEVPGLGTLTAYDPSHRIYARSASDDKAPIVALLAAFDALKASGIAPTSNVRVILDGEEEAGSPSLVPAIVKFRNRLGADAMVILDGPLHATERPTVVFGARGSAAIQLTVYGPKSPLHSGHYGNWIPNPAMRLAQLLATMKDDTGKVLVDGFYDTIPPFTPEEQAILDGVPDDPQALLELFGVAAPDPQMKSLQEALQYPSLNVRGMQSMFVGGDARTVIPDKAIAEIDVRLVKETPAQRMHDLVVKHIEKQGWHVVTSDPDDATRAKYPKLIKVTGRGDGTNAYRTSPLLPISKQVVAAIGKVFGEPPVQIRTMGGTVPIAQFIDALGFPALGVPLVNFDNNQHAENENVKLGHFFRAVPTLAAILTM